MHRQLPVTSPVGAPLFRAERTKDRRRPQRIIQSVAGPHHGMAEAVAGEREFKRERSIRASGRPPGAPLHPAQSRADPPQYRLVTEPGQEVIDHQPLIEEADSSSGGIENPFAPLLAEALPQVARQSIVQ